jgi:hypothetical protein
MNKRRMILLLLSLVVTFVVIRISLHASPNTDFNVGSYNIHHLFTGLLLITLCGIPATLFKGNSLVLDGLVIGFGIGLSLALDEFVYLITTDGSNASYLLPISFWGGVVMIGLACIYLLAFYLFDRRRKRDER